MDDSSDKNRSAFYTMQCDIAFLKGMLYSLLAVCFAVIVVGLLC